MVELSFKIEAITEPDYNEVPETVKQVIPMIDGEKLPHLYVVNVTEADEITKGEIKVDLIDKEYSWDTEI